eukprot:scaffold5078_cov69-Cylindrotheca_fusiformis.AAC.1
MKRTRNCDKTQNDQSKWCRLETSYKRIGIFSFDFSIIRYGSFSYIRNGFLHLREYIYKVLYCKKRKERNKLGSDDDDDDDPCYWTGSFRISLNVLPPHRQMPSILLPGGIPPHISPISTAVWAPTGMGGWSQGPRYYKRDISLPFGDT